MTGLLEACEPR